VCAHGSAILLGLLLRCSVATAQQVSADRVDPSTITAATITPLNYKPLTEGDRLRLYLKGLSSPFSIVGSAASAGIGQWGDKPERWKQGATGYGYRFASSYAQHITQETLQFGLSSLLQEDNRYFASGESTRGTRVKYAIESTFLARRNDGTRRFSFSRILAMAGASFISRSWQPHDTSKLHSAGVNFATSVGVAVGFNVAREFWPRKGPQP